MIAPPVEIYPLVETVELVVTGKYNVSAGLNPGGKVAQTVFEVAELLTT